MCNMDCFHCEYDDCINNAPATKEERMLIKEALKNNKIVEPKVRKRKETLTKYYAKNKEALKKKQLEYYYRNKEKIQERRKLERQKRKECLTWED